MSWVTVARSYHSVIYISSFKSFLSPLCCLHNLLSDWAGMAFCRVGTEISNLHFITANCQDCLPGFSSRFSQLFNYSLANSLGLFTVPLKQPLNATALDGRLLCTVTRKNKDLEVGTALFGISESHFLVQDIVVGGVRPQYPSQHLYRNLTLQVCPWVPFPFVSCSRTGDPRTLCLGHGQSLLSHVDASSPDAAT